MSKTILIKELKKEINSLNAVIDMRIIRGLPYKSEAKRHKFLKKQLQSLSWTSSFNQFISYFAI
ncbi:MAG: hypothetical protein KBD47_02475 [Candidatus Pacebacteria bacterium]|jgi:hypothetical protein|nr:hypothetical protein [Candidatus Paceibacterota bacterium]